MMRAAIVVVALPAALCAAAPSRDFYRNGTSLPSLGPRPYVSAIVMSYNHKGNIAKIAELLHAEAGVGEIVVAEDGSTDGSPEAWRAHLAPRDKLVASADVHEIRAYNGGARAATGAVYCFLQDDDLPDDAGWAREVLALFEAFRGARLGVVSGLAAEVCQVELGEVQVDHPAAMKNAKVTRPLPFVAPDLAGAAPGRGSPPFAFATEAWLSPLCVRADAWAALGGFDETLSAPGEPGIGLDIHLSLRAAADFGFTVGAHGAKFTRGVGGHGTVSDPAKAALRLRKRNEISQRIRQVAGCRWPPEMLTRAAELNARYLRPRAGAEDQRAAVEAQCKPFLRRPCPPRGQGGRRPP
ncbi:hypothetical protein SO694_00037226 [Aureococcus anophagefferens]|uniref:Glycosyltransferase 2-like domain-containing protein n=1 Tax=Aureococcus anophagefferens TaxID=44056 RepID=A0ABR1FKY5_AURAN